VGDLDLVANGGRAELMKVFGEYLNGVQGMLDEFLKKMNN